MRDGENGWRFSLWNMIWDWKTKLKQQNNQNTLGSSYIAIGISNDITEKRVHPVFYTALWICKQWQNTIDSRTKGRSVTLFCVELKRKFLPSFLSFVKMPTSKSRNDWLYMCTTFTSTSNDPSRTAHLTAAPNFWKADRNTNLSLFWYCA